MWYWALVVLPMVALVVLTVGSGRRISATDQACAAVDREWERTERGTTLRPTQVLPAQRDAAEDTEPARHAA